MNPNPKKHPHSVAAQRLLAASRSVMLYESAGLPSFVIRATKSTPLFTLGERLVRYFRRFRIITAAFRLLPWLLLSLSTNTFGPVAAAMGALLLPILLLGLLCLVGPPSFRYRRLCRQMTEALHGRTVYVLFPTRGAPFRHGSFWRQSALYFATLPNSAAVVVTPYFLSCRGVLHGRPFVHARADAPHLYVVRRHCFFTLKSKILPHHVKRAVLLY